MPAAVRFLELKLSHVSWILEPDYLKYSVFGASLGLPILGPAPGRNSARKTLRPWGEVICRSLGHMGLG